MNKTDFLNALRKELKGLKPSEVRRNLSYYDELISDMAENGLTEEEAVSRIGSPAKAAGEILDAADPDDFRKKDPLGTILILISAALTALSLYFVWRLHRYAFLVGNGSAVSIIGGADGPTSIFIAGRVSQPYLLYFFTVAVVVGTIIYHIVRRRKK